MEKYLSLLYDKKFDEALQYRMSKVPNKLLKFISLSDDKAENNKKFLSLKTNMAWFSPVKSLNDPYEFMCMYIDKKELKEHNYSDKDILEFEKFFKQQLDNWDILSLSNAGVDSLPMWAYYTNNSKGFCIEYEVENPMAIFPVSYEPKRIPITYIVANFFNEFYEMMEKGEKINPKVEFYASVFRYQLYSKHNSWKHEKEFRIIFPHNLSSEYGQNVSINKLGIKVNRIIAGIDCSEENKQQLNDISNELGFGNIYEAKISDTEYTTVCNKSNFEPTGEHSDGINV